MYPVSDEYKERIQELTRTWKISVAVNHSKGVTELRDKDLSFGQFTFTESTQAGEVFDIGGVVASTVEMELINKPEYSDIQWYGARITPKIGLEMSEYSGITYEDLQQKTYEQLGQSTYSELSVQYEYVPLGVFYADDYEKTYNTIHIKAMDGMILFDIPYTKSNLDYPATLKDIYLDLCKTCGVNGITNYFPNMDYIVNKHPDGEYTCRDILKYVASLAGGFAKVNRSGELELRWYKDSDLVVGMNNRFSFEPKEDPIQITGVKFTVKGENDEKDTVYLTGTEGYAADLKENPLLQDSYATVLPNIFANIEKTIYTPYSCDWQGNPAVQAGDTVKQIDRDGKEYNTLVITSTYQYRGSCTLSASGTSQSVKGYTSPTDRKVANLVKQETQEAYDKLSSLQDTMADAKKELARLHDNLQYAQEQINGNDDDLETARQSVDELNNTIIRTGEDVAKAQETADNANQAAQTAKDTADDAAADALEAAGLANSKGKVIIQDSAPNAADQLAQNLWIDTTGGANTPKKWNGATWVPVTDKAATDAADAAVAAQDTANSAKQAADKAQTTADQAKSQAGAAQATADGKNTVFYSAGAPVANKVNDTWYDTDDGNKMYRWDGSNWVATEFGSAALKDEINQAIRAAQDTADAASLDAIEAQTKANVAHTEAQSAQTAADSAAADALAASGIANSKGKVIIQSAAPTTADRLPQNLWIDTTSNGNTPKRWNGSAWVAVTDKAATDAANAAVTAQTTANNAASAAAEAQRSVDDMEIGGRNLILGTSKDYKTATFSGWDYVIRPWVTIGTGVSIGDTLTGRCYVKAGVQEIGLMVDFQTADEMKQFHSATKIQPNKEGYVACTCTVPDGATWVAMVLRHSAADTPEDTVQYKEPKLEKGSKPTDWTPAPEDVTSQIVQAQTTADGKNTVFYSSSEPVANKADDVWFDTDDGNKMYRWSGSAWTVAEFGTNAIANLAITNALIANGTIQNAKIANLDAGKITTGYLAAARLQAQSITADKLAANTITAQSGVIANAAIGTAQIADGTITTAKIGNAQINDAKIANLDAGKITTGTLLADRLGALSITADKIAAGAVTTDKVGANQITGNKIAGKTITADKIAVNTITANSGIIANAAITNAMIANLTADKITGGTITGITVRTAAGSNRIEMSDNSLKAYSAGVRRVELDYDSMDFYTPTNVKGGTLWAVYDSQENKISLQLAATSALSLISNAGDINIGDWGASSGSSDIYVMGNTYVMGGALTVSGAHPGIEFVYNSGGTGDPLAGDIAYIDCSGGIFRMNSAIKPGTAVTYSGISLMKGDQINIYFSGKLKHQFRGDGTKMGGSIEIDGKTWGMSPIDSPRVLFMDMIEDVEAVPEGTPVQFEEKFAKAMNGYKVFPNRPVEVTDITPKGFTVKGEGKVDLLIVGKRVKYEDTYWQYMEDEVNE